MEMQRIVIIGAGPCGLACARELERLGCRDWLILERAGHAGGLASSVVDPAGFTWDLGGHVVFSHFNAFDELLEEVMGDEILSHDRSSYVRFGDRWVPYPFQNNLRHLPERLVAECLDGLAAARGGDAGMDFGTWMRATFGGGITRLFMEPYNRKVWATPPEWMASDWIAERVAVVDYERALRGVREGQDDVGWGPNNRFVFPATGGTGEIYRRLAERFEDRIRYDQDVVEVDAERRIVRVGDGEQLRYDALVSTMPLDLLVQALAGAPEPLRAAAGQLRHNGVWMVGVGYEAPLADDKSWMYFPQDHAPFYRATNFAKYSPENVPGGRRRQVLLVHDRDLIFAGEARAARRARAARGDGVARRRRGCGATAGRVGPRRGHPLCVPGPDARARRRARGDPAVACAAWRLLPRAVRVLVLRDRQHGPRRQDGDRRRPPPGPR